MNIETAARHRLLLDLVHDGAISADVAMKYMNGVEGRAAPVAKVKAAKPAEALTPQAARLKVPKVAKAPKVAGTPGALIVKDCEACGVPFEQARKQGRPFTKCLNCRAAKAA